MGSVYFQEPSTEGAPGIWELEDALRNQVLGRWPTIPATVPDWIKRGPDGALPVDQADYALGKGWINGRPYPNLFAYMDAAGGTFSRGSDATYFDASGILRTAGPNVLRLDHDPATGKALGARLEGSSVRETNYPATFENNWNLWGNGEDGGNLLVRNAGLAPDGTMSANQLVAGAENGLRIFRYPGIVYSARRTRMICLKEGTYRYARLSCFTGPNARWSVQIDLRTGALVRNIQAPEDFEVGVVGLPNGWWLLWLDHVAVESARTDSSLVLSATNYIGNADNGWTQPSSKPAPGEYIWVWGGSMQTGIPSSLILGSPAGTAQRLADSLTFARAAPPEGTVVIEGRTASGIGSGGRSLWRWDDGTSANRYTLEQLPNRRIAFVGFFGGVSMFNVSKGLVADEVDFRVAASWKAGQFAVSLDGDVAAVSTSYAGPLPIVDTMRLGRSWSVGAEWFGTMARLGVFDRAYSPAELPEVWA